ncbi:MAG TPA: hypothetical protein DCP69_10390 [Candidatus Omnitrophica bacterium]|nr:hypothetical protein [Candidatus Omnitrophota bacterium]
MTSILSVVGKPALINWAANTERALVIEAASNLWEDIPINGKKMSRTAYVATLTERIGKQKAHQKELAKAADIGSQVHALIEWNLRRELGQIVGPEPTVQDKAAWAFMSYEDWRKATKLVPVAIEQVVWSTQHRYAGTMDLFADVLIEPYGSCHVVLDWKTGKGIYPEALLQNAAYVQALIEMGHATTLVHGAVVRLPKVETDPEFEVRIITPEEQVELFKVFVNVKALWDWSQAIEAARKVAAKA